MVVSIDFLGGLDTPLVQPTSQTPEKRLQRAYGADQLWYARYYSGLIAHTLSQECLL